MKVRLDEWGHMPVRAHETDAGLDIKAPFYAIVPARGSMIFRTGVHVQLPHGTAGIMKSKSGLMVRYGITSDGLIDEGYTGEIVVKLFNHTDYPYQVHAGDKISQMVIVPVRHEEIELVDELDDSERGEGGFGSTGR